MIFSKNFSVTGAALALMLSGCATITKGTTQTVTLDTPGAEGAQCTLSSSTVGSMSIVTPATISLPKGQDNIKVSCKKACFSDGVGIISSNVEGMAAGNVILGGVIGLGIDAATGAMNKYTEQNQIVMVAQPACKSPKV